VSFLLHRHIPIPSLTFDSDRDSKAKEQAKTSALPLEFITLTERPASQKANFSYTIRSHAMQSFLQAKKNPTKSSSKREPLAEVKSADQLSGKFKLSTWSRKPSRRKHPAVKGEGSEAGFPDSEVVSLFRSIFLEVLTSNRASPSTHPPLTVHCQFLSLVPGHRGYSITVSIRSSLLVHNLFH
jgi:hypothetical protein